MATEKLKTICKTQK